MRYGRSSIKAFTTTNNAFTLETNEPVPTSANTESTVWYKITIPSDWDPKYGVMVRVLGYLTIGAIEAVVDVFHGSAISNLVLLGGSMGCRNCYNTPTAVSVAVCVRLAGSVFSPNSTYYIRIGGVSGTYSMGVYELEWSRIPGQFAVVT